MNPEEENCINSYWMPTVVDNKVRSDRSELQKLFQEMRSMHEFFLAIKPYLSFG